jgi:uncharacterized protein (TIGR03083 family)
MMADRPEPVLVASLFQELSESLLSVLARLTPEDWERPTSSPAWSVHDVALHLFGGEVGQLGIRDDHERSGGRITEWDELVRAINSMNEDWVSATRRISPQLLIDLLRTTGIQVDSFFSSLDPHARGPAVSWAGPGPAPMWLHLAREYTERWHHQQEIREAVGEPLLTSPRMFGPVLATFVRALPRTYRDVPTKEGEVVRLTIAGGSGGTWLLVGSGESWDLCRDDAQKRSTSHLTIDQMDAWKLFTKGTTKENVRPRVRIDGDEDLALKLLDTVSMIV